MILHTYHRHVCEYYKQPRLFTEQGKRSLKETKGLYFTDQDLPIFILSQVDMYPISGEMAHRHDWGHSMFHSSTLPIPSEDLISCERYRAAQREMKVAMSPAVWSEVHPDWCRATRYFVWGDAYQLGSGHEIELGGSSNHARNVLWK